MTDPYERQKDRQFWIIIATLLAMAAVGVAAAFTCDRAHAECYPSLHSARSAHRTAHITWSHGCFYAGRHHERGVPASRRSVSGETAKAGQRAAASNPLPRPPSPGNDKLVTALEPRPVKTVRMVHVPEFDRDPGDHGGDASFDERFGPALAAASPADLKVAIERGAAIERLQRQAAEMRTALEELRATVRALEERRP